MTYVFCNLKKKVNGYISWNQILCVYTQGHKSPRELWAQWRKYNLTVQIDRLDRFKLRSSGLWCCVVIYDKYQCFRGPCCFSITIQKTTWIFNITKTSNLEAWKTYQSGYLGLFLTHWSTVSSYKTAEWKSYLYITFSVTA